MISRTHLLGRELEWIKARHRQITFSRAKSGDRTIFLEAISSSDHVVLLLAVRIAFRCSRRTGPTSSGIDMSSVIGKLSRRSKFFTKSFVTPCNLEALAVSNFLRQLEMSAGSQFSLRLAPEISAPHFLRTSHRCSAYLHCKSRIDSLAFS